MKENGQVVSSKGFLSDFEKNLQGGEQFIENTLLFCLQRP
jgi:hypothetical protein